MSTSILPLAVWASGTNQNSIPANDNALRLEALSRNVISKSTTEQPASPADGDVYIIPGSATGAQWSTFTAKDIAIFRGGTWYAWAPVDGLVVNLNGALEQYDGSWSAIGGGGGGGAKFVNIALSDLTTNLTTGALKGFWVAPEDGTMDDVWLAVGAAQSSSGVVRVDVNRAGSTILSTRPAIDASESTSLTGTAAVISSAAFSKGDLFTFDIDDAGTGAKGLQVVLEYTP